MADERKIVCYIAASLDGYIAAKDDSLDWLFQVEMEGDAGYADFMETIDTVVMGRRTYDWVMEAEKGVFPYSDKTCYVFSHGESGSNEHVVFTAEEPRDFVNRLKAEPGKNIWIVGGSQLLHSFLKERLMDEFIVSLAPVLIGSGIPLFQELDFEMQFELKDVERSGQFVQFHVVKK